MEKYAHPWITDHQSAQITWRLFTMKFHREGKENSRKITKLSGECAVVLIFDKDSNFYTCDYHSKYYENYTYSSFVTFVLVTDHNLWNPGNWATSPAAYYVHILGYATLFYSKTTGSYHRLNGTHIWDSGNSNLAKTADFSNLKVKYLERQYPIEHYCPNLISLSGKNIAEARTDCDWIHLEFLFLGQHFNMSFIRAEQKTGYPGYQPTIKASTRIVDAYTTDDITGMGVDRQSRSGIIYCKEHSIFGTTSGSIQVWLTPFDAYTWFSILLLVAILAGSAVTIQSPIGMMKMYFSQIYLLVSILIRNGVKDCPYRLLSFVLFIQVIPYLYESIITGKLLAPIEPIPFSNVGELVNRSFIIQCDRDSYEEAIGRVRDVGLRTAFENNGIANKFNSSFNHYPFETKLVNESYFPKEYLLLNALKDKRNPKGYFTQLPEIEQLLFTKELEIRVRLEEKKHRCHLLPIGDPSYYYWFFYIPHRDLVLRAHASLREFGNLQMWQDIWKNRKNLIVTEMEREWRARSNENDTGMANEVITAETLERFFTIWGIVLLFSLLLFLVEIPEFGRKRIVKLNYKTQIFQKMMKDPPNFIVVEPQC